MKKIIITSTLFLLYSCTTPKWDKATAKKELMKQLPKTPPSGVTLQMEEQLADCVAEKMIAKYKSLKEANADEAGTAQLGADCGKEILLKNLQKK